jgi:SAM-dependent methyltransferase
VSAPAPAETYAFDNDDVESADRHRLLAAILDEFTFARLARVGDLTGARCLDIGAGGGSVARWLADQVGPTGRVLATDLNTRHLPPHPGYEIRQHDLLTEPVPEGPWDLIHARLVLSHLPQRRETLQRLVAALAPGGALVVQEWDGTAPNWVLSAPDPESAALLARFQQAASSALQSHGFDPAWSRHIHQAMLEEGLAEVDTEVHARAWNGGTPGVLLLVVTLKQLRDKLLADGLTSAELERVQELAHDPRVVYRGLLTFSTIGRRPV